jgi:hypothetical protein
MTMRRLPTLLLIAAACGAVLSLGTLAALLRAGHRAEGSRSPVARSLAGLLPASAGAQEVMEFKPVPAESVSDVVRPRGRRATTPDHPAAPSVPAPPAPPASGADIRIPGGDDDADVSRSGDVVRFGSDIHVRSGQTIAGDVVAMGGDVTVDGHVEGDVVAMGGDVILNATAEVDGQVVTLGGQLREQPGSHVGGQRVSAGGLPRGWFGWPFLGFLGLVGSGLKAAWAIAKMVVLLLVAWGFTQLAPKRTLASFEAFKSEPLMCFGLGLLAWALIIPSIVALALVVAILCITIIGIPLALAVLLGYVLTLVLLVVWGYVVGAAVLGERLAHQLGKSVPSLTLMAVWGIVGLTVVRVIGTLFGGLPMGGFAGGLLVLMTTVVSGVLITIGAGSLLRTQARREAMGNWWPSGRGKPGAGVTSPESPTSPLSSASVAPADPVAPPMPIGDPPSPPPTSGQ